MLAQEDVDVVFTDVVMPGLSGVELAEALRHSRPGLPVVLATGYSPDVVAGTASGAKIVRKPYDGHAVSVALATVIAEGQDHAA